MALEYLSSKLILEFPKVPIGALSEHSQYNLHFDFFLEEFRTFGGNFPKKFWNILRRIYWSKEEGAEKSQIEVCRFPTSRIFLYLKLDLVYSEKLFPTALAGDLLLSDFVVVFALLGCLILQVHFSRKKNHIAFKQYHKQLIYSPPTLQQKNYSDCNPIKVAINFSLKKS